MTKNFKILLRCATRSPRSPIDGLERNLYACWSTSTNQVISHTHTVLHGALATRLLYTVRMSRVQQSSLNERWLYIWVIYLYSYVLVMSMGSNLQQVKCKAEHLNRVSSRSQL